MPQVVQRQKPHTLTRSKRQGEKEGGKEGETEAKHSLGTGHMGITQLLILFCTV